MNKLFLLVVLLFNSFFAIGFSTIKKDTTKVIIDLRHWDFEKDGNVALDGVWKFYWQDFISPDSVKYRSDFELIDIDYYWNNQYKLYKSYPAKGFATYSTTVLLSQSKQVFALYFKEIQSAFKCYVNGKLIAQAGKVGVDISTEIPYYKNEPIPIRINSDTMEIVFHVSNYHHSKSGFFKSPKIGEIGNIMRQRVLEIFLDILLFSSLLILGLYHIYIYITQQNNKAFLWFGIFSLIYAFTPLLSGADLLKYLIPSLDWYLLYRIKYLSLYLAVFSFSLYVYFLRKEFVKRYVYNIFGGITLVFALSVVLSPYYFTRLLPFFFGLVILGVIYFIIELIIKKGQNVFQSKILISSIVLLFFAAINELLVVDKYGTGGYFISFVLLLFFFGQADVLSRLMNEAFVQVKELSSQLENNNEHLESLVEKRHKSIVENYNQLVETKEELEVKQDIIIRQRELLKKRRKRLQNTLNFMPEMLFECDENGQIMIANNRFYEVVGISRKDYKKGVNIFELIFVDSEIKQIMQKLKEDGEIRNKILTLKNQSGIDYIVTISLVVLCEDSVFKGYRGIMVDVSAQEKLRKQMYKLQSAVEQSVNAVSMTDLSGKIEFVNNKFLQITNMESDEVLGKDFGIFRSSSVDEEFYLSLWKKLLDGQNWQGDVDYKRDDGKQFYIHTSISPMFNDDGDIEGFMAVMEDFTDIVKKENARLKLMKNLTVREKELTQSMNYARVLQNAILSSTESFKSCFNQYFIINRPLDIVSGDFYYVKRVKDSIIIAVADGTGHGIPGSIISALGISLMNEVVQNQQVIEANTVLHEMRDKIVTILNHGENKVANDGIDMALCVINIEEKTIEYAGANRPLIVVKDNNLEFFKPDRQALGFNYRATEFSATRFEYNDNCKLYLFSDGFTDQFGGDRIKKYGRSRLLKLITSMEKVDLREQKSIICAEFEQWRGDEKQIDDMLFVGVEL